AEEYSVTELVIGMPLMLDGSVGIQAEKVQVFVEALKRRTNIPIIMSDERLSTSQVERVLISQDQSRAKRKQVIDKMAAAVILQTHMDKQSFKARMEREEDEW
ncbi:MAG TPA: Holliday junction resolvase RuvX, partial [Armatimonadota bacterium]